MRTLKLADLKVPSLLVLLSIVPTLGGVLRFLSLSGARAATPDDVRFSAAPAPIIIHVLSVTVYGLLGAFQFSRAFRLRSPRWHRRAGKLLVVCGLLAAVSGMWMTACYAIPASLQGPLLYVVRMLVGAAIIVFIVRAYASILRRDVVQHEAYMIRAYALAQGAGTQVFTLMPWMLVSGEAGGLTRDVLMTAAWLINACVAEAIIHSQARARAGANVRPGGRSCVPRTSQR
jgi:uncharacterized membrane protein